MNLGYRTGLGIVMDANWGWQISINKKQEMD
jgi:hypothetical protein